MGVDKILAKKKEGVVNVGNVVGQYTFNNYFSIHKENKVWLGNDISLTISFYSSSGNKTLKTWVFGVRSFSFVLNLRKDNY